MNEVWEIWMCAVKPWDLLSFPDYWSCPRECWSSPKSPCCMTWSLWRLTVQQFMRKTTGRGNKLPVLSSSPALHTSHSVLQLVLISLTMNWSHLNFDLMLLSSPSASLKWDTPSESSASLTQSHSRNMWVHAVLMWFQSSTVWNRAILKQKAVGCMGSPWQLIHTPVLHYIGLL